MGYKYFVSFVGEDDKGKCDANAVIGFKKRIDSMADIIEIGEGLKTQYNFKKVVINNFVFLKEEILFEDALTEACEALINEENDSNHIPAID